MAFNSVEYLVFLALVAAVLYGLPSWAGTLWLLGASYYFYACWNSWYLALIVFSTLLDYLCALLISRRVWGRKRWLLVSLCSNLGLLFAFKYYGFFSSSALALAKILGAELYLPVLNLLLPVGISFYTLQTMSYTFDVYRGRILAETNLFRFSLFVAAFPQLVAGPIERAGDFLPQLVRRLRPSPEDLVEGARLIGWGLFKKTVVADRLSVYVQWAFADPAAHSNASLLISGFLANVLIYADFSAYADIAVGSARLLGLRLSQNFNFPLFSVSMPDFWRRWHLSLHNWFLDYVYFPLGGSRVGYGRFIANVFVIFLLSGLWHGAAWNFVIWGCFHFALVFVHIHVVKALSHLGIRLPRVWWFSLVGMALVHLQRALSMFFFFISDISKVWEIFGKFWTGSWALSGEIVGPTYAFGFALIAAFTLLLFWVEGLHLRRSWSLRLAGMGWARRFSCYYAILFLIMLFGMDSTNPFIYFQF
ncbi:MAG: MBOAT family protein [Planctomycetes bacterium]|nr:MBOAT family protein [Planctomycetota bacterium]